MPNDTVEIEVTSHLSFDSYDCEGRSFYWTQVDELKEQVAGRKITWIRGKNVFKGTPVSDDFFNSMVNKYYEEK